MKKCDVDWSKIESSGTGVSGGEKKIMLDHLPRGGKYLPENRINWGRSVGEKVDVLYDGKEYIVTIDGYDGDTGYLMVNIVGYNKVNYKIHSGNFVKCKLNKLINNVYANPNSPNRKLIIDSVGVNEAKTLTPYSNKKIQVICPECKAKQSIQLCKLTERGFRCNKCSDGFTFPERLMRNVLLKLNIEFQCQLTWDGGKHFYDFYLPEFNAIIETHGIQHYEQSRRVGKRVKTLEEEQENDSCKRKLAMTNGVKDEDYHEIDCRISTLEWCKPNIEKVLKFYTSAILTEEEWREIALESQRNLLFEVCKRYEATRCSSNELAKEFNISSSTIQKYLKIGHTLNLCNYGGKEEQYARMRTAIIGVHNATKEVVEFISMSQAKCHGYRPDSIKQCIEGKRKDYKGYTWYKK